jgi:hypothetical protein
MPAPLTRAVHGVDYAAVGVGLDEIGKEVLTYNWRYQSSKSGGVRNARDYLKAQAAACSTEKWVLVGYSQGAHVLGDLLSSEDGPLTTEELAHVGAVVFLADPRFNSQEGFVAGTHAKGRNGVLGARTPGDLSSVGSKIKSWCDAKDPVCQGVAGGYDKSVHDGTRYANSYKDAIASFVATTMGWERPKTPTYTGKIDVAFAIDTTGSMGDDIDRVKAASTSLFASLRASGADARVALVDYGDPESDPYQARVNLQFTADPTQFSSAVNSLSVYFGGDEPEYVLSGIYTAVQGLTWRDGGKKIIVVLGDAGGKDPEPIGGLTTRQVLQAAFDLDPAQIYGVALPGSAAPFFRTLAEGSSGEVFEVDDPALVVDVLTQALTTAVAAPVAVLSPVPPALPGETVTLSAAASYDPVGTLVSYEWDFDADGTIDATTTEPTVQHNYPEAYAGMAAVTVTNDQGIKATGSGAIDVRADVVATPPAAVSGLSASVADRVLTVAWNALDSTDGYYLSAVSTVGDEFSALLGPEATSIQIPDVPDGEYLVRVAAVNLRGFGPFSEVGVSVSSGSACTITGTENPDTLRGTNADDVICGLGGNDTILGLRGNDTLYGGPGDDQMIGGPGNDSLVGEAGNDRLIGELGNDVISGGEGDDQLLGSEGDDSLDGGPGNDRCRPAMGSDNLVSCER